MPLGSVVLAQLLDGEDGSGGEAIVPEGGVEAESWILAAGILVGSVLLAVALRRLVVGWVERRDTEHRAALIVGRFLSALTVVGGLVYALSAVGVRIGPLLGALGIGGIAFAFALQHILENSVASVLLQTRRPFQAGDQISSNEHRGTVEAVTFRAVMLRTEDNDRVFVPSAEVLRKPLLNHTAFDRRRTTVMVGVAYDTDLDLARRVLLHAATAAEGVLEHPPTEAWVEQFGDSSIDFAVRFWHPPRIADEWRIRDAVARTVKRELDAAGITIAFPQRTLWFPEGLGEPGDRGLDTTPREAGHG